MNTEQAHSLIPPFRHKAVLALCLIFPLHDASFLAVCANLGGDSATVAALLNAS